MGGEGRLPPGWGLGDFDFGDPLDPFEAASAWGYEADGEAVAVGQPLAGDVGGEQKVLGVVEGEAPVVAGGRADEDAAGGLGGVSLVEDSGEGDAFPALFGEPAAGAVDGGGLFGELGEVGVGEGEFVFDLTGNSQGPGVGVDGCGSVVEPRDYGVVVAGEAAFFVGAGEASGGAGEGGGAGDGLGELPGQEPGDGEATEPEDRPTLGPEGRWAGLGTCTRRARGVWAAGRRPRRCAS